MEMAERFQILLRQRPQLRLYGLVDGVQYQRHTGQSIVPDEPRNVALFANTNDAPLAAAGPWLFDLTTAQEPLSWLTELEQAKPAVIWLFSGFALDRLGQLCCA